MKAKTPLSLSATSLIAPLLIARCLLAGVVFAGESGFSPGPAIEEFGSVADVSTDFAIPRGVVFKHSFDASSQAEPGELNKTLVAAARFINMHARAGVPADDIQLAVVVHGGAVKDVVGARRYADAVGGENVNAPLVEALLAHGVGVVVCGQSASYYDVANDDLLPGVRMALSAMTAHAMLQQMGYTVNPF